eukprot:scaffold3945_cov105-Isochrysis_galbana.AAC.5
MCAGRSGTQRRCRTCSFFSLASSAESCHRRSSAKAGVTSSAARPRTCAARSASACTRVPHAASAMPVRTAAGGTSSPSTAADRSSAPGNSGSSHAAAPPVTACLLPADAARAGLVPAFTSEEGRLPGGGARADAGRLDVCEEVAGALSSMDSTEVAADAPHAARSEAPTSEPATAF